MRDGADPDSLALDPGLQAAPLIADSRRRQPVTSLALSSVVKPP